MPLYTNLLKRYNMEVKKNKNQSKKFLKFQVNVYYYFRCYIKVGPETNELYYDLDWSRAIATRLVQVYTGKSTSVEETK